MGSEPPTQFRVNQCVRLTEDVGDELERGDVGCVRAVHPDEVVVAFADLHGRDMALLHLRPAQLAPLT